ncbi:MAG TPA: hypothetical protein VG621_02965 [Candidatus Paceibacterota bacterium]|nr:hypothetical protein [Candidatus Paceibacterota bacterium]
MKKNFSILLALFVICIATSCSKLPPFPIGYGGHGGGGTSCDLPQFVRADFLDSNGAVWVTPYYLNPGSGNDTAYQMYYYINGAVGNNWTEKEIRLRHTTGNNPVAGTPFVVVASGNFTVTGVGLIFNKNACGFSSKTVTYTALTASLCDSLPKATGFAYVNQGSDTSHAQEFLMQMS